MSTIGADSRAMRQYLYSLIDLGHARSILDVGCGTGHDALEMGRSLPAEARIAGLDLNKDDIERARSSTASDRRYSFLVADASQGLPFKDERFDLVFSHNVLEWITDKEALLRDVHRVLQRWGQVVFAHFDWDSQLVNGVDRALVRKILGAYADWKQAWVSDHDAWMGRRLWGTFQRADLFDGDVFSYVLTNTSFEPGYYGTERIKEFQALVPAGLITQDEYDAFYRGLETLAARGEYFYSITTYAYSGRKR